MPLRRPDASVPPPRAGRAAATIAARLTFEQVERRYQATVALAGFSLDIAPAEVVCLLGPSGCGKTTLLRVAAGIERPTGGRVLINDQEVAGPTRFVLPEKRNVGLMFQDFALFPHLSILDNVAFGLKSLPREDARREALAALARVGLERYAGDYPHILSGGEQQRVALARAIVPRPAVMLMDEPFSGLDVQLRERLQEETLALLRETRATCLIVDARAGRGHPARRPHRGDACGTAGAGGQGRGALPQPGRSVRRPAVLRDQRDPAARGRRRAEDADRRLCRARSRRGRCGDPVHPPPRHPPGSGGQGLPGRVLHARFLGDLAVLEIAAQGFERPLLTLVREWEVPERGAEVSITVDPESVLVFPAEGRRGETEINAGGLGNARDSSV